MEGFFFFLKKIYKRRNEIVFLFWIVWVAFIYLFIYYYDRNRGYLLTFPFFRRWVVGRFLFLFF